MDVLQNECNQGNYENVMKTVFSRPEFTEKIFSPELLGTEYQLQDYVWIIQKSAVSTCHRDNNGDFFNQGQQHPSYTILVYVKDLVGQKCLSVYPESHTSWFSHFFNFVEPLTDISCGKGDIIIFNANLIHVGTILPDPDNLRIQLKATHRDDIPV
jgi:hypothetical protein